MNELCAYITFVAWDESSRSVYRLTYRRVDHLTSTLQILWLAMTLTIFVFEYRHVHVCINLGHISAS